MEWLFDVSATCSASRRRNLVKHSQFRGRPPPSSACTGVFGAAQAVSQPAKTAQTGALFVILEMRASGSKGFRRVLSIAVRMYIYLYLFQKGFSDRVLFKDLPCSVVRRLISRIR